MKTDLVFHCYRGRYKSIIYDIQSIREENNVDICPLEKPTPFESNKNMDSYGLVFYCIEVRSDKQNVQKAAQKAIDKIIAWLNQAY